jgi:hypothetical protein
VDSHLERGSTFTIYLPASPSFFWVRPGTILPEIASKALLMVLST